MSVRKCYEEVRARCQLGVGGHVSYSLDIIRVYKYNLGGESSGAMGFNRISRLEWRGLHLLSASGDWIHSVFVAVYPFVCMAFGRDTSLPNQGWRRNRDITHSVSDEEKGKETRTQLVETRRNRRGQLKCRV